MAEGDFQINATVCKVDESLGLVFGWAMISTEGGKPYVDLQDDWIPEDEMLIGALDLAEGARVAKDMHTGAPQGTIPFIWPMTADIAKAMGISCPRSGMLVGMRPSPELLAKFKSGEYTGFSIGGLGERVPTEVDA